MTNYCNTITDYPTATGVMPMLYSIRDCIPFAFQGILLAVFILLVGGNYFLIKSRVGKGRILSSLLGSSIVMLPLSMFLAMGQLVTFMTPLLYAFLSIVFYILLKFSD